MPSTASRSRAALMIAVMAAVLAVSDLGGGNATDDMIGSNIKASDTWAFYQAKNVRQNLYKLAAEELQTDLASGALPADQRASAEARLNDYRATIARYDSEPDAEAPNDPSRGEGKKQLSARAKAHEAAFAEASARTTASTSRKWRCSSPSCSAPSQSWRSTAGS
jgi:hypothetical protein